MLRLIAYVPVAFATVISATIIGIQNMEEIKTNSEKFNILIEAVLEEMIHWHFPGGLSFDIPGTDNEAILQVIMDALENGNYRFRIGVHRNGYDMLVSNFWEKGSEEELRKYFKNASKDVEEKNRLRAALENLSACVDDKLDMNGCLCSAAHAVSRSQ